MNYNDYENCPQCQALLVWKDGRKFCNLCGYSEATHSDKKDEEVSYIG